MKVTFRATIKFKKKKLGWYFCRVVWDVLAVIEQNIKWKAWLDSETDNKGQRSNKKKK